MIMRLKPCCRPQPQPEPDRLLGFLRLPRELGPLFEEWLGAHFPDRKAKVLKLMREIRGESCTIAASAAACGEGAYAYMLAQRFPVAVRRIGLDNRSWDLNISDFRAPGPAANWGCSSLRTRVG